MSSSAISAMMTESSFFVLEDADGPYPCSCCSPQSAWDGDRWTCSRREWILLESAPDFTLPHSHMICEGRCGNLLHSFYLLDKCELFGLGMGDLVLHWEAEELAKLSEADRAARAAAEEEKWAKEAALAPIRMESLHIANKARSHEITAHCKNAKPKQMRPCKYLYSCEGDRKTGGARPTTLHISSECWSHSYTDPLTKKVISKHACWFLHPGEAGWCNEWVKNRNFMPSSGPAAALPPPTNFRGAAGGGGGGSAATGPSRWRAPPPPPPSNPQFKNRFSGLDSW